MEKKVLMLKDFETAAKSLEINEGDVLIVHSSFKSLGPLENGADTVVTGLLNVLGENGTLVFPTLCQKDWAHVYENWHMDADSDVGYLTNYFRKLPGALRSNQATHSVAAIGKYAKYITETHGQSGKRIGAFGDTPFAADSPWEKMYGLDAKVLLIGTTPCKITHRHLAEYKFIDKYLKMIEKSDRYEELKSQVWTYGTPYDERGPWALLSYQIVEDRLLPLFKKGRIGQAECYSIDVRLFVDKVTEALESRDLGWYENGDGERLFAWLDECEKCIK